MGGTATHWEATYGMVRYFTVNEVQEIAEVLNHISFDDLQQRCDRLFDDRESRAYMEPHYLNLYNQLCQFFTKAAREGDMILLSFD
ncbi:hypothetical protein NIES2098_38560 [Calothrix sp. NIES-2098]|nr:hypothetical protein NIES2098_38560 [Calothrix sp. NIES-2098]